MFSSLKTKIIFFISLVMIVTAAVILYFTHRDVGRAMFRAEEAAARNVLRLIEFNIRAEYEKLVLTKIETLSQRRNRLKHQARVAASVLDAYGKLVDEGLIPNREARKKSLNWIRSSSSSNEKVFVIERSGRIVAHPVASVQDESIAALTDLKGRFLIEVMRDDVLDSAGDIAVFRLDVPNENGQISESKKLAFFLPFSRWQWTVGAVIDISDVEAEADRELNKIISVLQMTTANIKIAENGGILLFNGRKEMLISKAGAKAKGYETIRNALTGNLLLEELMDTAKTEKKALRYIESSNAAGPVFEAYIRYFKSLDWYIAVVAPVEEIQAPANRLVTRHSLIIAMIFLCSLGIAYFLVSRISRPLKLLAAYARELPRSDFTQEENTCCPIDVLAVRSKDEVKRLAESFDFMQTELRKNVRDLMATTAANERIQSELNVARKIQLGFLAKEFPAFPDRAEFDLHATLESAKEVGGDLFDFFLIDDSHLFFAVGDVSGKGVPAALFMAVTISLLKGAARRLANPADILSEVNKELCRENQTLMFVTLLCGILNIKTGEVLYANAGHNPPLLIRKAQQAVFLDPFRALMLGGFANAEYRTEVLHLEPGDSLFLYSDGITEARNEARDFYTAERLQTDLSKLNQASPQAAIDAVMQGVNSFCQNAPQFDDITMLMVRYNDTGRNIAG